MPPLLHLLKHAFVFLFLSYGWCALLYTMKILNWNVRGLGDDDKCSLVRDVITSCCPSVVCLQETKLPSLFLFKLRSFLPASYKDHVAMPSDGTAGGILVAWDSSYVLGQLVAAHRYHVTVRMSSTTSANSFLLTVVYAPCSGNDRAVFYEAVSSVATGAGLPWIVLGDFNMYRFAHEKSRGQINWNLMELFNGWAREHGLDDIQIDNRMFTWSNKISSPTLVRLDRILVNAAWNLSFLHTSASCVPATTSDHTPILVQLQAEMTRSRLFRVQNHWLQMEESRNIIQDCWSRGTRYISSSASLINFKMRRVWAALR
ncbi:hypothetical protein VPH35_061205 [Triticum aestivum]|uniref:Endonuclease/exonuclease/phosphatase domain-containing protein n=1 Tax=Aegilops tauschii subsp. strangulata TaxID=200361 RepID=A0A453FQU2_AEGTS|nr:uncharacterized protein LOC109744431 [Aegilops tauschii subsp. strangulata]XP_044358162.1 uncharacterized protein LOC123079454 [Triticum aestivum]